MYTVPGAAPKAMMKNWYASFCCAAVIAIIVSLKMKNLAGRSSTKPDWIVCNLYFKSCDRYHNVLVKSGLWKTAFAGRDAQSVVKTTKNGSVTKCIGRRHLALRASHGSRFEPALLTAGHTAGTTGFRRGCGPSSRAPGCIASAAPGSFLPGLGRVPYF